MKIIRTKKFNKMYKKLSPENQFRVKVSIRKFSKNPFDPSLKNHALSGKLSGLRAISAAYDLRLIFEEKNGFLKIIFIAVGTHAEMYG